MSAYEFRFRPKGPGVRASSPQLYRLNEIPGGLARALRETGSSMEHVDADVAWQLLYEYARDGQFVPATKHRNWKVDGELD